MVKFSGEFQTDKNIIYYSLRPTPSISDFEFINIFNLWASGRIL